MTEEGEKGGKPVEGSGVYWRVGKNNSDRVNRAKRKRIEVETKATGWLARLPVVQRL